MNTDKQQVPEVPEWTTQAICEALPSLRTGLSEDTAEVFRIAAIIARHAPAAAAPDAQLREDYQKVVLTLAAFDLQYHRLLRIAQKVLVYQSPNTSSTVSVPRSVTEDLAVVCNEKTPEWPAPSAAAPSSEGPSDAQYELAQPASAPATEPGPWRLAADAPEAMTRAVACYEGCYQPISGFIRDHRFYPDGQSGSEPFTHWFPIPAMQKEGRT